MLNNIGIDIGDEHVVLRTQLRTAVYKDENDDVVIYQDGDQFYDEKVVIISPQSVPMIIAALSKLVERG